MLKKFIDLESKEFQAVCNYYNNLPFSLTLEEKQQLLYNWLKQTFNFPDNTLSTLSAYFISYFNAESPDRACPYIETSKRQVDSDILQLSIYDINFLTETIKVHYDEYPPELFRLLVTYAAFARANPHPNNWIKCDAKDKASIMFLASCSKLSTKKQENLTNLLHLIYNMNMRVVGSNQPIPCYQLSWQVNQPPLLSQEEIASHVMSGLLIDSHDNYLIDIGPQEPATINNFIQAIVSSSPTIQD